jgi:acetyl-CoA carboxylase carboxyltransferase component
VIKTVTGEEVTFEALGGSQTHTASSGVADLRQSSEGDALLALRKILSYMPSNNLEAPPHQPLPGDPQAQKRIDDAQIRLRDLLPENPNQPYNMKDVIEIVLDPSSFFEVKEDYAPNIVIGFGRLGGHSVGIVANNPNHLAGVLDIDASVKGARFVRFCDAFNIPLLTFVDVPGFLPGTDQETAGIIRHGAKLLYAFSEATVPRLTVITRKAYGGAYDVMNSKHIGADLNLAWPQAEIAVMGPEGACNIIFRSEINKSANPDQTRKEMVASYSAKFATPYEAARRAYIDAVIFPEETRRYLLDGLKASSTKRVDQPKRKHGNIPL